MIWYDIKKKKKKRKKELNSLFNIGSQRVESRMILLQVQVQSRTDRASDGIRKSARFLLTNETPQLFPDC